MVIMRHVPNVLSVTRFFLALSLLFIPVMEYGEFLPMFLVVYTIAGLTDMIDGPLARRLGVAGPLGANLDGIADYTFVGVGIIRIVPVLDLNVIMVIVIIAGFVLLKAAGVLVGYMRYGQLMMMHTYAAKTTAFLAFLFPLVYHVSNFSVDTLVVLLGIWIFFYLTEEIAINTLLPEPQRDISGIRQALRLRREKMTGSE